MNRFVGLVAALLSICVLSQAANAGAPPPVLGVSALRCVDSPVGDCEFGNPTGPFEVNKLFAEPGLLTLTGFASGQGTSAPFQETIENFSGGSISAYQIALSTNGIGIAAFNNGADLHLLNPLFVGAAGSCGLMNGNLAIFCSGMNVPHGGMFGVTFSLTAPTPVSTSFALVQGPASVPEPATLALLGLGLAGLAASRRRRLN